MNNEEIALQLTELYINRKEGVIEVETITSAYESIFNSLQVISNKDEFLNARERMRFKYKDNESIKEAEDYKKYNSELEDYKKYNSELERLYTCGIKGMK